MMVHAPVVVVVPIEGAGGVCLAGNQRRKGLPHAFHSTPLVIMGSLSGLASGCSAQGCFNNGKM